jgi:polyvinyl alcohol dehydrogenase (cytochrome)
MIKRRSRFIPILATVFSLASLPLIANTTDRNYSEANLSKSLGQGLYEANCAACHQGGYPKAPHKDFLGRLPPDSIMTAITVGSMSRHAENLSASQMRYLVEHIVGQEMDAFKKIPAIPMCGTDRNEFDVSRLPAASNWGYETSRFIPESGLDRDDVSALTLKWTVAFPGASRARSLPVIAYGAVYVGSQDGTIYALDLETGCARWKNRVSAEVRTGLVVERINPGSTANPRAFFGDLIGRVHAIDAFTGRLLWSVHADSHSGSTITGNPIIEGDRLFVPVSSLEVLTAADPNYACCTFRGSVIAINTDTGEIQWRHHTIPEPSAFRAKSSAGVSMFGPSGAGVWGSPTIDKANGAIYHGSSENYSSPADENSDAVFAIDISDGKRLWRTQLLAGDAWNGGCYFGGSEHPNCPSEQGPDFDISAPPLLIQLQPGKNILVVGQKSGVVHGLDPSAEGAILWRSRIGTGGVYGGVHFGMANEGSRVYVPIVDILIDSVGDTYLGERFSGIHAVEAATGEVIWSQVPPARCDKKKNCHAGISAAVTAIPGVVFAGHIDGMLRAYDGVDGKILWEIDTAKNFQTLNGVVAHGGSISGSGPAVGDGHLLVNSGYDFGNLMPGNLLMSFSID